MKKFSLTIILASLTLLPLGIGAFNKAYAVDVLNEVCTTGGGASSVCQGNDANNSSTQSPILHIMDDLIKILSLIIGIASVIVIIVQGIRMVLSNGDPKTFENARNTILLAVVGVIIAIMAQIIVTFVLQRFAT